MAVFDRKDDYGYIRWAQEVKQRDHYTCAICGRRGVALHSHHLNAWAEYPDQRYDVENGVTLCQEDHNKFHDIYGKGKNTESQFKEFASIMSCLIKNANNQVIIVSAAKRMLQAAERDLVTREIINHLDGYEESAKVI